MEACSRLLLRDGGVTANIKPELGRFLGCQDFEGLTIGLMALGGVLLQSFVRVVDLYWYFKRGAIQSKRTLG